MDNENLWQIFMETGDPAVYLVYREGKNNGNDERNGHRGEGSEGRGLR